MLTRLASVVYVGQKHPFHGTFCVENAEEADEIQRKILKQTNAIYIKISDKHISTSRPSPSYFKITWKVFRDRKVKLLFLVINLYCRDLASHGSAGDKVYLIRLIIIFAYLLWSSRNGLLSACLDTVVYKMQTLLFKLN